MSTTPSPRTPSSAPTNAVTGFARYINASCAAKNKCLAGRKLVVNFYDSHLNGSETRDAEIEACSNDVAMVGTSAVFLTNIDDMRNCKDQAGATTGLPDIPFLTTQSSSNAPISPSRSSRPVSTATRRTSTSRRSMTTSPAATTS